MSINGVSKAINPIIPRLRKNNEFILFNAITKMKLRTPTKNGYLT
ncbi:hypothetical protein GCM10007971_21190 [Oceanobacillus indicireducens]|uniref:Uncharacterized protein n=1 Tax=Oceanobacillus indicireducens TaxID=1004261 RepID=A0A917XXW0_9BACI|nr:hypothetical protein GCM10007971_21190 [Oceanobacillus indicireducens]